MSPRKDWCRDPGKAEGEAKDPGNKGVSHQLWSKGCLAVGINYAKWTQFISTLDWMGV